LAPWGNGGQLLAKRIKAKPQSSLEIKRVSYNEVASNLTL